MKTVAMPTRTVTGQDRVCRGCQSRHHERCTGYTRLYETVDGDVLRLVPCDCTPHPNGSQDA